jgi:hypothetical protein
VSAVDTSWGDVDWSATPCSVAEVGHTSDFKPWTPITNPPPVHHPGVRGPWGYLAVLVVVLAALGGFVVFGGHGASSHPVTTVDNNAGLPPASGGDLRGLAPFACPGSPAALANPDIASTQLPAGFCQSSAGLPVGTAGSGGFDPNAALPPPPVGAGGF